MNRHIDPSRYPPDIDRAALDEKIKASIDVDRVKATSVFAVGNGGANGIYENLVRLGVRRLTVIDFDRVGTSNLVTQGWYADQIGKLKTEALAENVGRLIPAGEGNSLSFLEGDFLAMEDVEVERLAEQADLLLFMADDFRAQARGNRLALKLKKPAIFAMMYARARCCEVSFIIPGVTPACHRCATSSRYDAYINRGYKNDVTSDGSHIFHTQAINSIIGMLAMAIIHNDKPGFEFSEWFGPKWERNLLQFRMNPNYESNLFKRVFGMPQAFCFDAVWQKIEVECPPKYQACPDCGGTGDLRHAKIGETRDF